jgi:hypothetical protein
MAITWRTVTAPNQSGANNLTASGMDSISRGLSGLGATFKAPQVAKDAADKLAFEQQLKREQSDQAQQRITNMASRFGAMQQNEKDRAKAALLADELRYDRGVASEATRAANNLTNTDRRIAADLEAAKLLEANIGERTNVENAARLARINAKGKHATDKELEVTRRQVQNPEMLNAALAAQSEDADETQYRQLNLLNQALNAKVKSGELDVPSATRIQNSAFQSGWFMDSDDLEDFISLTGIVGASGTNQKIAEFIAAEEGKIGQANMIKRIAGIK